MFYSRIDHAMYRANDALRMLSRYNFSAHPRSMPNAQIRNDARLAIDPLVYDLQQAVREGRWERVGRSAIRQADRAWQALRAATWSLSDRPEEGRPANVYAAQNQIRDAVSLLRRARW